jgi:membrane protease YdiL (CAAX protease family)
MEALSRQAIFTTTIILEASLLLIAAIWLHFSNIHLLEKLQIVPTAFLWGLGAATLSTLLTVILIILGKNIPGLIELRKMSEETLAPLLHKFNFVDILLLSVVSGFCEEVLFRGVIQSQGGIWATSLAFGLFHDPSLRQKAYVIFACLAGLGLGYLYNSTGNLWSAISAHVVHNFCAMLMLRYWMKPVIKE